MKVFLVVPRAVLWEYTMVMTDHNGGQLTMSVPSMFASGGLTEVGWGAIEELLNKQRILACVWTSASRLADSPRSLFDRGLSREPKAKRGLHR